MLYPFYREALDGTSGTYMGITEQLRVLINHFFLIGKEK